jgi:hypothetical protein
MLPTKFRLIWPSSFRGGDIQKLANQKQELPVVAMFGNGCIFIVYFVIFKWNIELLQIFIFELFSIARAMIYCSGQYSPIFEQYPYIVT